MSTKSSRGGKGATRSPTEAATSRDQASTKPAGMSSAEEEDELPLLWQKMSNKLLQSFNERFDKFELSFQSLLSAQKALTERLSVNETQTADHEQRIHAVETSVAELRQENKKLRAKLSDLEGRSRRNNIKIVGIPEGEEKGRPTEFVSNLIPKLLGDDSFTKPVVIDRAHRTQQPKPPEGSRPRTIIARVHLAQDKEKILRLGRQRSLDYGGQRILIFPDYTAEVMEQRRSFREVLKLLREKEIRHSLRFPARLHVHYQDQVKLKDDAVALVDIFAPTDFILNSPLGNADGQLYKNLWSTVLQGSQVLDRPSWWQEFCSDKPMVGSLRPKL